MSRAAKLFEQYHLRVFRYLRRSTGSHVRAEDLTQEVFVRITRALPTYRARGREVSWVFTVARNVLQDESRTRSRRPEAELTRARDEPRSAASAERRIEMKQALADLDPVERDVFLLREVGGLGYAEISAACGLTPDAVRSRIYRARVALRNSLGAAPVAPHARNNPMEPS